MKTKTRRKTSQVGTAAATPVDRLSSLSLNDLEVPVEPLLDRRAELSAGRMVRSSLSRIAELLPRHPRGYRSYLGRMGEVLGGGGAMFAWISLRLRMEKDFASASRALERARTLARRDPAAAIKAYEAGVAVLQTYPLDPENLFKWCRQILSSTFAEPALEELPRFVKIDRILRRLLARLESARDRLVMPNFRLVLKEVFRYLPQGMRHSDLFQEGVLGLHKAVFRFDPNRSTRFSTYATYWIRQSIRKALIDKARMIRVPQAIQEELRRPSPSIAPAEVERVRKLMSDTVLFSARESDDGSGRSGFVVADPGSSSTEEALHLDVIPGAVSDALEGLDFRSREVIQRRFGLTGTPPQTLEEIGKTMNLSRERIRQIEREALNRMSHSSNLREVYEDLESVGAAGASND